MKRIRTLIAAVLLMLAVSPVSAQYFQIANQIPGLLQPALSGSMRYRGFVEGTGIAGIGPHRANFLGVSTSQGFQYADWFFMGVGVGVDVAMAHNPAVDYGMDHPDYFNHSSSETRAMIPVFTDFRFNLGSENTVSAFFDVKVGATWLIGGSYLEMGDAYLSNGTQFLLRPTIGVRVPVNAQNSRQAVSFGLTYQLITSNNNYYWNDRSVTLNGLGLTIGFEW